ncbi:hypothetical protein CVT25_001521 [Psilocybe cyanescens]|uniref:Phytocyanin domain-containing protein n=1 Tax=Psilocybe cyanescens TaxID=93625 RepID=A0A409X5E4_PSICY|nr:hypothetical protein CVT25_001521 [Psilocybe cyanescens]
MLTLSTTLALTLLPCLALGASFQVQVGANGGLEYNPSSITATDGDTVVFTFNPKNHTVTQTSFASPCAPLAGGFDTGFIPLPSGSTTKTYTIPSGTGTSPLWFSCAQATHCQQGMVFAINPPASNHTFDAFKANAQGPAGVATVASTAAAATNTLGSHDPATASGSVFSAASVQDGATGSVTNADVPTTTPTASVPTGGAGAGNGSGSGAGGATPTGAKTGGAVKSTAGVRDAALTVGAVFFAFNFMAFV